MTHPDTERLLTARDARFEFVDALPLDEVHEPTSAEQQYRVEVYDPATVVRYKADLEAGDQFPPLIVRRRNKTGGFVLLSGMHRWHAARELSWEGFPAYIVRCTPAVGRLISFDANRTHGKPLSASELGELAARLVELDGMTTEDAAKTVGATVQQVGTALAAHRCDRRAAQVADLDTTHLSLSLRATLARVSDDHVFGDTVELVVEHNLGGGAAQQLVAQVQKLDRTEALQRVREMSAARKGFAGGRGHRKPERERLQNALFGLLDVEVDQVVAELVEAPDLAEFTRSRIRDSAAHLLKLGRAVDAAIGAGR